jgi:putative transposase
MLSVWCWTRAIVDQRQPEVWISMPICFATLDDARAWVLKFSHWYNHEHKHSGLKFMTPHQRHRGQAGEVMGNRKAIYGAAKEANPRRWSKDIRDWDLPDKVWLNPEKDRDDLEVAA